MVTFLQLLRKSTLRLKKLNRSRSPLLKGCPQKKGVVTGLAITSPKKPNSAKRQLARVKLSTGRITRTSIPGTKSSHQIKQYSRVLLRGGAC